MLHCCFWWLCAPVNIKKKFLQSCLTPEPRLQITEVTGPVVMNSASTELPTILGVLLINCAPRGWPIKKIVVMAKLYC